VDGSFCFQEADVFQTMLWSAGILSTIYGALTAAAGIAQTKAGRTQRWAAWGLVVSGLVVIAGAVLTWLHAGNAFWVLAAGLVAIHALAINNGLKMFGKINPSHHVARLVISVVLLALTYLSSK
jgi:hypothetical protein